MSEIPTNALFEASRLYVSTLYGPSRRPIRVMVVLDGGEEITLPVPVPWQDPGSRRCERRHSSDFRSAIWDDKQYSFTPTQAAIVRQLWEAMDNGMPDVGQETLLEGGGSQSNKVGDLFRNHPAWGVMIRGGSSRGTFRLAEEFE
jgi:hypothetical protein